MSKYDPLWTYLQANGQDALRMTFGDIQTVLGFQIDHAFLTYKKDAALYGYEVGKISLKEKHIDFRRTR